MTPATNTSTNQFQWIRSFSAFPPDYTARAQQYGFIAPPDLHELLKSDESVVLVDVRSEQEIQETGRLGWAEHRKWVHQPCTLEDTKQLEERSAEYFSTKDTPVILYCKSGRRASKAKEMLETNGYTSIHNAGGYDDLKDFLAATK